MTYAQTKGVIDFMVQKASETGIEDLSVDADFQVHRENIKIELDFELNKVQTAEKLDKLDVYTGIQYNILLSKQVYTYAAMKYKTNTGYEIRSSTSFGMGGGYFPGLQDPNQEDFLDYNIQAGLFLNTKYFDDNTYERNTILNLSGGIIYPINDIFSAYGEAEIDFNMRRAFYDYESIVDAGVKAKLTEGEKVSSNLKICNVWRHNHLADIEDQKVYGIKIGLEF